MKLSKNNKVFDLSTPFAVFGMATAGAAMLLAIYIIGKSENAVLGVFAAAALILGSLAFVFWIAGAFSPRSIDGPGIYYTGALYTDRDGDLTDSPINARHTGWNGVVLDKSGIARFALLTQCNGHWQATPGALAPEESGWRIFVKSCETDFRQPIHREMLRVVGGFIFSPGGNGELEVIAADANGATRRVRVKVVRSKMLAA